jgi:hypothetical protein
MYRLFPAGEVPAGLSKLIPPKDDEFGHKGAEADYFSKLRRLLAKMEPDDQKLLLHMAQKSQGTRPGTILVSRMKMQRVRRVRVF